MHLFAKILILIEHDTSKYTKEQLLHIAETLTGFERQNNLISFIYQYVAYNLETNHDMREDVENEMKTRKVPKHNPAEPDDKKGMDEELFKIRYPKMNLKQKLNAIFEQNKTEVYTESQRVHIAEQLTPSEVLILVKHAKVRSERVFRDKEMGMLPDCTKKEESKKESEELEPLEMPKEDEAIEVSK